MLAMSQKRTPPDLSDLSALTRGELEGVVLTLWERLEALESKVAKNSRNSRPPRITALSRSFEGDRDFLLNSGSILLLVLVTVISRLAASASITDQLAPHLRFRTP
jgi:hypothetical protein